MKTVRNLVFIKHQGSNKKFMFEVPVGVELMKGEKVFCDTRLGNQIGTCATSSFYINSHSLESVMEGFEATMPLRKVIGYAEPISEYRLVKFK